MEFTAVSSDGATADCGAVALGSNLNSIVFHASYVSCLNILNGAAWTMASRALSANAGPLGLALASTITGAPSREPSCSSFMRKTT